MSRRVAIVTDSTASVPRKVADQLGIAVIQLELQVGEDHNDERRIPHVALAEAMRGRVDVVTSPPPPEAFYWNYTDAVASGAEAIISVHLSEALSKTCEAARTAAAEINIPVYVVDSRLAGLGLGFPVIAAAEAAQAGATVQGVLSVLDRRLRTATQMIYVDTLEYLQRSGRVGKTQALLGQALSIKPVLILKDGSLVPMVKGIGPDRTLSKAVARAVKRAGNGPVDIAVEHFQFHEQAEFIMASLRRELPEVRRSIVEETSAIIGAHTGPGALGITVSPV